MAFRDINSQAPPHILIIPKKHIPTLAEASEQEGGLLGHLLLMARQVAEDQNLRDGYRVVINNGVAAGQPSERERVVSSALQAYAALTTSASRGAVRDVSQVQPFVKAAE